MNSSILEQLFVISRLCCNFQPCDAADVQEPTAQEKERSPHELLHCDNGTSTLFHFVSWFVGKKVTFLWFPSENVENVLLEISRTESDVEEEHSTASDPVETAEFSDVLEQSAGSEDEAGSFIDLKMEEEQWEPCTLLTGQEDFEEELSSPETEEEGDSAEEKPETEPTRPEESGEAECMSCVNPV